MLDALEVKVDGLSVSVGIPSGKQLDKAIWTNAKRPWVNISKGEATRLREIVARLVKQKL
jgi:hypothetical protein